MSPLEIIKIIFYGVVEGITEWLPVSSTGHLILFESFWPLNFSDDFMEMFRVVIQLGAILSVIVLYFERLNPWSRKKSPEEKHATFSMWGKVIAGCLPVAILGFLLDDWFDAHFYRWQVVVVTLIVYGVLFIVVENRNRGRRPRVRNMNQLTYGMALLIGCFQCLSLVPGTSRSGSTILGAILFGVSRPVAAEFSFFMAIPVMLGASLLKIVKFGLSFTGAEAVCLVLGMAVAFFVSIAAIRFLMGYIRSRDFKVFGWYRIVLGVIVAVYFLLA